MTRLAIADAPVIEVTADLNALPADARDFLEHAEQHNFEFGFAWYRNLVNTVYADDPGVRFYILRKAGRVVGLLPLRAERLVAGWRLYALGNFYTTLYQPVLESGFDVADLVPLLSAIRRDFAGVASLMLSPMDLASNSCQVLLAALRAQRWLAYEYFSFGNWYCPIIGDWAEYLRMRQGTLRSTIKRMSKKFVGDGGVLEIISDTKDIAAAIRAYEEVYAASWKKAEPFPDFMPGLIRSCAEKGSLRLGIAWLNGQPIAAQVWIVCHGRAAIYKVAYHEDFKSYSPGTLVTAMLMQHVIDVDKVGEVDYLIGDDPYKKTWMSHRRERWGIIAYNPRSVGGLAGLARESMGRRVKVWNQQFQRMRANFRNRPPQIQ